MLRLDLMKILMPSGYKFENQIIQINNTVINQIILSISDMS